LEKIFVGVLQVEVGDSLLHSLVEEVDFLIVELQPQLLIDQLA
jgi:hypothetical protein